MQKLWNKFIDWIKDEDNFGASTYVRLAIVVITLGIIIVLVTFMII
jgi:hypothetical protein